MLFFKVDVVDKKYCYNKITIFTRKINENKIKKYTCREFGIRIVATPSVELMRLVDIVKNDPYMGPHKINLKRILSF